MMSSCTTWKTTRHWTEQAQYNSHTHAINVFCGVENEEEELSVLV